jgi:uncharacterized protein YecE (DUF72 family)
LVAGKQRRAAALRFALALSAALPFHASVATGQIRIGISGWRYAPWRGVFYPEDLPQRLELSYAAQSFTTIEINGSFYSLQSPDSYASWYRDTPQSFQFALKGPRFLTHMKRLKNVERPLANFLASGVFELRAKLGPILWQLPPNFAYDRDRIDAFLDLLPKDTAAAERLARRREKRMKGRCRLASHEMRPLRHALEVRHASFCSASFVALLRQHGIGLVVSDSPGHWPRLEDVTADFVYVRLHGDKELYQSKYGPPALSEWTRKIRAWSAGRQPRDSNRLSSVMPERSPRDVYCYFDNDAKVAAPANAAELAHCLGQKRRTAGAPIGARW